MTVTSIRDAWAEVQKIFPTDYEHDTSRSERAGYPIYYSTAAGMNAWISDLGNRLEVNLPDGQSVNIWIKAPVEVAAQGPSEDTEDEVMKARFETAKRIRRATYYYTEMYVKELDKRKHEIVAEKKAQERYEHTGKVEVIVMTAENNAKVMMGCITDCIHAVNILKDKEQDVEPWMLAGINAMMDKANEDHTIPFDLTTSICGLLCAQYR